MPTTEDGEFKGQIRDIQNESSFTLSEKEMLHFIPWDKVKTMKVILEKIEYIVSDDDSTIKKTDQV